MFVCACVRVCVFIWLNSVWFRQVFTIKILNVFLKFGFETCKSIFLFPGCVSIHLVAQQLLTSIL